MTWWFSKIAHRFVYVYSVVGYVPTLSHITKPSDTVFSAARREQYVRAQERSSALIGEGKTKEDFGKIVNTLLNHF